jgi:hypothetical protein
LWTCRSSITIVESLSNLTTATDLSLSLLLSLFDFFEFNAVSLSCYTGIISWESLPHCNKLRVSQVMGVEKCQWVSLEKS